MGSVLTDLLREAELALAGLRAQRGELDRAERVASEKVAHLRALVELEASVPMAGADVTEAGDLSFSELTTNGRRSGKLKVGGSTTSSDMRPEDIAAAVLGERGPLHYRELWDDVARRGGNIVSGNPAAVLLTRISRDDRFAKDNGRGVYRLTIAEEPTQATPKRRRRKGRRRAKKKDTPAMSK